MRQFDGFAEDRQNSISHAQAIEASDAIAVIDQRDIIEDEVAPDRSFDSSDDQLALQGANQNCISFLSGEIPEPCGMSYDNDGYNRERDQCAEANPDPTTNFPNQLHR